MVPKWHILFGFVFAYIVYWFTSITIFEASLIFLASVLIDFDHYLWIIKRKGYFNLKKAYYWHKKLPKKHKSIMHIFHSIEFILFIGALSFYFNFLFFILIGIIFHSILDILDLIYDKELGCREFSLIRFLILRKKYPNKYF